MKKILTSPHFIFALSLVLLQQIFVAVSTYFIGLAGQGIASARLPLLEIVLFFGFIFLAYLPGGVSLVFTVKAANRAWKSFYEGTLVKLTHQVGLQSAENRDTANALITTEAHAVITETCHGWQGLVAVVCNVLFNSAAIGLIVDPTVGLLLIGTFVTGVVVIRFANGRIKRMAGEIQESRSRLIRAIYYGWDNVLFGAAPFRDKFGRHLRREGRPFFRVTERYEWFEMLIANGPVMLSILILTVFSWNDISRHPLFIGAYIAVLPRTIQIFQYMHAITGYMSRLTLLETRLHKIGDISEQLDRVPHADRIDLKRLKLERDGNSLDLSSALRDPKTFFQSPGRYRLSGSNGAGKSTCLMLLKELFEDGAVMIAPDIELGTGELSRGSCGQNTLAVVSALIETDVTVFLLDEWNANLDPSNYAKVNALLESAASDRVIIEATNFLQAF